MVKKKFINTRLKGYKTEKKVVDYLESQGYEVHRPPQTKYGDNDIFNTWDLVAVNWEKRRIRFIQVKADQTRGYTKIIEDWFEKYKFAWHSWELWVYHTGESRFTVYDGDPAVEKETILVGKTGGNK